MKILVDDVLIDCKSKNEWLNGFHNHNNENLIITSKSIDWNWISDIRTKSTFKDGIRICDSENRFFVLLYLVFSLKRRVHFDDIIYLYNAEKDFTLLPASEDVQCKLWGMLNTFMRRNGYCWKIIKDSGFTFSVRGRVPLSYYPKAEWFSKNGIKLFLVYATHSLERRYIKLFSKAWRKTANKRVYDSLKKHYVQVSKLNIISGSGNLFFWTSTKTASYFVKVGSRSLTDIQNEIVSVNYLRKKSRHPELYIIPESAQFADYMLVSPFDPEQVTLADILEKELFSSNDIGMLIDYCIEAVRDLKSIGMVHRDIQPANFIVNFDSERNIIGFQLMDFGCATNNGVMSRGGIRQKIMNRYAGNQFRFSSDKWDDAGSMFYMIMQLKDFGWNTHKNKMAILYQEIMFSL